MSRQTQILEGNRLFNQATALEAESNFEEAAKLFDLACAVYRGCDQDRSNQAYARAKESRAKGEEELGRNLVEQEAKHGIVNGMIGPELAEAVSHFERAVRLWDLANRMDKVDEAKELVQSTLRKQAERSIELATYEFKRGGFLFDEYRKAGKFYQDAGDAETARKVRVLWLDHSKERAAELFSKVKDGDSSHIGAVENLIRIFKELDDFMAESHARLTLGQLLFFCGKIEESLVAFDAANKAFEKANDQQGQAEASIWEGKVRWMWGGRGERDLNLAAATATAVSRFERTLDFYGGGSDGVALATVCTSLCEIDLFQGDVKKCKSRLSTLGPIVKESGSKLGEARILRLSSQLKIWEAKRIEGLEEMERACNVLQVMGENMEWVQSRIELVKEKKLTGVDTWRRDEEEAKFLLSQVTSSLVKRFDDGEEGGSSSSSSFLSSSENDARGDSDWLSQSQILRLFAQFNLYRCEYDKAFTKIEKALNAARKLNCEMEIKKSEYTKGVLFAISGKLTEAEEYIGSVEKFLRAYGVSPWLIDCIEIRARIAASQKNAALADKLIKEAIEAAEGLGFLSIAMTMKWSKAMILLMTDREAEAHTLLLALIRVMREVKLSRTCMKCGEHMARVVYICPLCPLMEYCTACYTALNICHKPSILLRPPVML